MSAAESTVAIHDLTRVVVPASPKVAATLIAGTEYMWLLAFLRLLGTYTTFWNTYALYNASGGDVAGMWLYMSVAAVAVYLVLAYGLFRKRDHVGSLRLWIAVFAVSVIIAP